MFADITSANVVGYQSNDLRFGATFIAPNFIDVGSSEEGVDIKKFIPGGDFGSGDITVSRLDAAGRNIADYSYMIPRRGTPGWADESGVALTDGEVVLAPGEGVAVIGDAGLSLTTAGQVSTVDRVIALRFGATFTGNFTAVAVDITSIIPGGEYGSGDITISKLDAAGRNIADYSFMIPRRGTPGWADENGTPIAEGEVIFNPGEGFAVIGDEGLSITIPGPTL